MRSHAAILVGGGGRRFDGRCKPLIEVDGVAILDRQLAVLRSFFDDVVLVADNPEPFMEYQLDVFPDRASGCGPLGALGAAVAHFDGPVFVVAGDMPFLRKECIQLLWSQRAVADAVAPCINGLPEPLHAVYSRACLPIIDQRLAQARRRTAGVLQDPGLDVCWVDEASFRHIDSDLVFLTNINHPADLTVATR